MGYITVKKAKEDFWWLVFVSCEFIGKVYFNGSCDLEISDGLYAKLRHNSLNNNDLMRELESSFSYDDFYTKISDNEIIDPDLFKEGLKDSEGYDDIEISRIADDYDCSDVVLPNFNHSNKIRYLEEDNVYNKNDTLSEWRHCFNIPGLRLTNDGVFSVDGLIIKNLEKVKLILDRMEKKKKELLKLTKTLVDDDNKFKITKSSDKLDEYINIICNLKKDYGDISNKYKNVLEEMGRMFFILRDEIRIIKEINGTFSKRLVLKEKLDPLVFLYEKFKN